ncbi:MAG: hypothetical protein GXO32_05035 [Crenarchaeota archaeon]|nr:hypothetical protein [Thermoproteota archaeon]
MRGSELVALVIAIIGVSIALSAVAAAIHFAVTVKPKTVTKYVLVTKVSTTTRTATKTVTATISRTVTSVVVSTFITPYTLTETTTRTVTVPLTVWRTVTRRATVTQRLCTETVTTTATVIPTVTRTVTVETPGIVRGVQLLVGNQYYSYVKWLLGIAKGYVYVMMFAMKYYPSYPWSEVNQLIHELCQDHKKGLDVRVLVDYTTYSEYPQTIRYLEECGVPVKVWRECGSTWRLHAKVIIVDGSIVVIGSHNWTYSALSHNIEVSIALNAPIIARMLTQYFDELWSSRCAFTPSASAFVAPP